MHIRLFICTLLFSLNFGAFAQNLIGNPHVIKKTKIAKVALEKSAVKEGLYKFETYSKKEAASLINILVINQDRYPGFHSDFGVVQTPIAFAQVNTNNFKFESMHLEFINPPIASGNEFYISSNDDPFKYLIIKLK